MLKRFSEVSLVPVVDRVRMLLFAVGFLLLYSILTMHSETSLLLSRVSRDRYTFVDSPVVNNITSTDGRDTKHNTFNPGQIGHVYHVGHRSPAGRSNNQILTLLHAVDNIIEDHGEPPNNRAVVALRKWAFQLLKDMVYNGENSTEFALELEQLDPVLFVHEERLDALGLTASHNISQTYLHPRTTYDYVRDHRLLFSPEKIERNRRLVFKSLFRNGFSDRNRIYYNAVKDYLEKETFVYGNSKNENGKYVAVHSRWLEGSCERRVGDLLPKDECWMTPSYIKNIMGGVIDRPIVLIGDGQNKEVIENLKRDIDIGPALIIPQNIISDDIKSLEPPQPWNDMAIAIMSDTFIGTRISTFATVVGMFRVLTRGADPASNYLYTSQNKSAVNGQSLVEVCEDCLFFCDPSLSHLCGDNIIYS